MINATKQFELRDQYAIQPFAVKVLSKERTLCEKIMSLVRFSQTTNPYEDLSNKVRHIYDIHLMLKDDEINDFLASADFETLLLNVRNDDIISFKNNNEWLKIHPSTAIIFSNPADIWHRIKTPYRTTFKELVIGELPDEEELIAKLKQIQNRLVEINWDNI